jgi:ribosomal protein S18 acetylase RimI-like enzyme
MMSNDPQVLLYRDARPEDVEELARLDHECFGRYAYPARLISTFIELEQFCVVAEDPKNGAIAGFAVMMTGAMRDSGLLVTLDVAESWRRRRVGSAMVGLCAKELQEQVPGAALWLTVASMNVGAQAFYGALGFERTGEIPGYYRDDDARVMVGPDVGSLVGLAPDMD